MLWRNVSKLCMVTLVLRIALLIVLQVWVHDSSRKNPVYHGTLPTFTANAEKQQTMQHSGMDCRFTLEENVHKSLKSYQEDASSDADDRCLQMNATPSRVIKLRGRCLEDVNQALRQGYTVIYYTVKRERAR